MAISIDTISTTGTHTVNSGSDRLLIVLDVNYNFATLSTPLLWNGYLMTYLTQYVSGNNMVSVHYIIQPKPGTGTITNTSTFGQQISYSFFGADAYATLNNIVTGSAITSLTTTKANSIIIGAYAGYYANPTRPTIASGNTEDLNTGSFPGPEFLAFHRTTTTIGSYTIGFTNVTVDTQGSASLGLEVFEKTTAYTFPKTFTFVGTGKWAIPDNVTSLTNMKARGKGGNGSNRTANGGGGGGGGGAYAEKTSSLSVSAGDDIDIDTITNGDVSVIKNMTTHVLAKAGISGGNNNQSGSAGGDAASCVGDIKYSGGGGANYDGIVTGGGGEGACSTANGNSATGGTGGTGAGDGGDGGNGRTTQGDGSAGASPGGGGAGARRTSSGTRLGGAGGSSYLSITFTTGGTTNTTNFFSFF